MSISVLFFGEDPRDPLQRAAIDFLSRAGRRYRAKLIALDPVKRTASANDEKVRLREAELLLKNSDGHVRIAMDPGGKLHSSSRAFANDLENMIGRGRPVSFLIGGATGLHPRARDESHAVWSLSPLTFAHRLAVCVLAEQIYRAAEIARGGPYAK